MNSRNAHPLDLVTVLPGWVTLGVINLTTGGGSQAEKCCSIALFGVVYFKFPLEESNDVVDETSQ